MKFVGLIALIFCFITSTVTAQQMSCASRSGIVSKLAEKFQEKQVALGLDTGGRVVELFVSSTGSFTILMSYPNGQSCVAATGEGWQTIGLSTKR